MPTTLQSRRRRHGATAVEFALLMPVFVLLIGGLMEFSWMFFVRSGLTSAVRESCRAGAMTSPEASPDPEQITAAVAETWLTRYGISCTGEGATCTVSTDFVDAAPNEGLRCTISLQYRSLSGLAPTPETLVAVSEMRLERQRSE